MEREALLDQNLEAGSSRGHAVSPRMNSGKNIQADFIGLGSLLHASFCIREDDFGTDDRGTAGIAHAS